MKPRGIKRLLALLASSVVLLFHMLSLSGEPVLTVLVPATFPNLDPGETVSGDQSMVLIISSVAFTLSARTWRLPPIS